MRDSLTWAFSITGAGDELEPRDSAQLDATHRHISAIGLRNLLHIGLSVPSLGALPPGTQRRTPGADAHRASERRYCQRKARPPRSSPSRHRRPQCGPSRRSPRSLPPPPSVVCPTGTPGGPPTSPCPTAPGSQPVSPHPAAPRTQRLADRRPSSSPRAPAFGTVFA